MADEKDDPAHRQPAAPGSEPAAGAPPTAPPGSAPAAHPAGAPAGSAPPVPTPPMTAAGDRSSVQAVPAPRSNAATGVTDPAPARPEGVAPAEPTVPADAKAPAPKPAPPRPATPAAAAAAGHAPAAIHTKRPADSAVPGGPNPVAEDAARTIALPASAAPKPT